MRERGFDHVRHWVFDLDNTLYPAHYRLFDQIDVDYSHIRPDPRLDSALAKLPGRKWVFTNGTVAHAEAVMDRLGISRHIDEVFDITHSGYMPKPFPEAYRAFVERTGVQPRRAAMFEDIARNLEQPHEMGMMTVLVDHPDNVDGCCINDRHGDRDAEYVHHVTDDLSTFLATMANRDLKLTKETT